MTWDVFISHASEDKEGVARPLARLLETAGLRVWLDEAELTLGDSLRRNIDDGLARSRYGIVVLSPAFFAKDWPQRELNALAAREGTEYKVILPVWHGVDKNAISHFSPLLADRLAVSTDKGLDYVAAAIIKVLGRTPPMPDPTKKKDLRKRTLLELARSIMLALLPRWLSWKLATLGMVVAIGVGAVAVGLWNSPTAPAASNLENSSWIGTFKNANRPIRTGYITLHTGGGAEYRSYDNHGVGIETNGCSWAEKNGALVFYCRDAPPFPGVDAQLSITDSGLNGPFVVSCLRRGSYTECDASSDVVKWAVEMNRVSYRGSQIRPGVHIDPPIKR